MSECHITNAIRKLRFNHGEMTQDELAKKVGVTRQTIIAIENAKYSPSLELAFRIARIFGTTVEEVFSFEDKNFTNSEEQESEFTGTSQ
ncbi:MAG: helix-turn-helix transcriptional regulator [Chloroflexota bacterium]